MKAAVTLIFDMVDPETDQPIDSYEAYATAADMAKAVIQSTTMGDGFLPDHLAVSSYHIASAVAE